MSCAHPFRQFLSFGWALYQTKPHAATRFVPEKHCVIEPYSPISRKIPFSALLRKDTLSRDARKAHPPYARRLKPSAAGHAEPEEEAACLFLGTPGMSHAKQCADGGVANEGRDPKTGKPPPLPALYLLFSDAAPGESVKFQKQRRGGGLVFPLNGLSRPANAPLRHAKDKDRSRLYRFVRNRLKSSPMAFLMISN